MRRFFSGSPNGGSTISRAVLGILLCLLVGIFASHILLFRELRSANTKAYVVEIAARQQRLIDRTAHLAHRLATATHDAADARTELRSLAQVLGTTHLSLVYGDASGNLPGRSSPAVGAVYFQEPWLLDGRLRQYVSAISEFCELSDQDPAQVKSVLHRIDSASTQGALPAALDALLGRLESERRSHLRRVQALTAALFGLLLAAAAFAAWAVFRPLARRTHQAVAAGRDSALALRREQERAQQAEAALRMREAELKDILDNGAVPIQRVDLNGIIVYANEAQLQLGAYPREGYVGKRFAEYCVDPAAASAFFRPDAPSQVRIKFRCADQSFKDLVLDLKAMRREGKAAYVQVVSRDVTERKQSMAELRQVAEDLERKAEENTRQLFDANKELRREIAERQQTERALRESEARFQGILDNTTALVAMKDREGRHLLVNRRFETLFQVNRKSIAGKTDFDLFPAETAKVFAANDQRVLDEGAPMEFEETVLLGDGLRYTYLSMRFPVRDSAGKIHAVCSIATDITERKRGEVRLRLINEALQENQKALVNTLGQLRRSHEELQATQLQLIEAEKSESIGRLAAGVAHEVKNPLAIILTAVECLSECLPQGDNKQVTAFLNDIWTAVRRADSVIRGLLNFSVARSLDLHIETYPAVVDQALSLVRHELLKGHVTLEKAFVEPLPALRIDRTKVEQVLLNLLMNAIQAMPAGGKMAVRVYATRCDALDGAGRQVTAAGARLRGDDPVIVTEIDDSGSGIIEEQIGKIFDPFFTTKPTGQGTGLGLSVSRTIVELHGGMLDIRNRPEGGVRATLVLRAEGGVNNGHEEDAHLDRGRRGELHASAAVQT